MLVRHSRRFRAGESSPKIKDLLATIAEDRLREWVDQISVPRHFAAEPGQNRATAAWLVHCLESMDFKVHRQGGYSNLVALPRPSFPELIVVGAHYDSVPGCPGADDNGSAVAALLGCAAACSLWRPILPIAFVAFNCEEDGLRGSADFVGSYLPNAPFQVHSAHILEMVGYAKSEPGSQRVPAGLPIKIDDKGDFLGLLANGQSSGLMNFALLQAAAYAPGLPVTGLNVKLGLESYFPVLRRSDHAPFWEKKIPAVMWTDTSEFRNPHYHQPTDTPETLNYRFLLDTTRLLTACVIEQAERELMD